MLVIVRIYIVVLALVHFSPQSYASSGEETVRPTARVVFSFDGGGVRGAMTVVMLMAIEKQLPEGARLVDYVDLFAGTSTGGLIAIALAKRDPIPLEVLLELYLEESHAIFTPNNYALTRHLLGAVGLFGCWQRVTSKFYSKYEAGRFEGVLEHYVGDAQKLSTCETHLLSPALSTATGRLEFFKTSMARVHAERDCSLIDAALATAAAPTFFPYKDVTYEDGHSVTYADGGLQAVNPTISAYVEATKYLYPGEIVYVISLGTGDASLPLEPAHATGGALHFAGIVPVVMSDPHPVDYMAENIIPEGRYFRLQPEQTGVELDDVTQVPYLIRAAEAYVALPEIQERIRQIASVLLASRVGVADLDSLKLKPASPR